MKQIKFRGRNIKTGIFHFGFYSEYPIGNGRIEYCITDKNLECWAVDPDSVAQLVGYDTNGNEVYEGDELVDSNGTNFFGALFYTATTRKISDNAPGILKDCVLKESQDEEN